MLRPFMWGVRDILSMLLKFIRCEPKPGMGDDFSKAQESWSPISNCLGFHGQLGGWNNNRENAYILSLWKDEFSLNNFMSTIHDEIFIHNCQEKTYDVCEVDCLNLEMLLDNSGSDYEPPINNIKFIRVADCTIHKDSLGQFISDQKEIWNPAMISCAGMLGGFLARFQKNKYRFLVISFWESVSSHQEYMSNVFPEIKSKVKIDDYIKTMSGIQIEITRGWDVIPNK